jgi:hypothetical protein
MPDPVNTTAAPAVSTAFIGLQSYTEAQADRFFGRDEETEILTKLIKSNILTIVFGKSGTGKTSLLNAGVFPRLRKDYCLPFRIRLEFGERSPGLISQVKKILKQEIDKYGFKPESYPADETLWEYFHKEPLWKTITPVLIFDQFEEIFTLAKNNPRFSQHEMTAFWDELSDVIENSIPEKLKEQFLHSREQVGYNYKQQKAKVLFAFREEYLPEFESLAAKIPSLKYSRFRLLPMNGQQAYEVITKTWKENISSAEAKQIVSYFTNTAGEEEYNLITVEPSLLSQVCAYIDKERLEAGGGKVSADLLNKYPKEIILRAIYEEAVAAASNALTADAELEKKEKYNRVKVFLEEKLLSAEGFRTRYHLVSADETMRPAIQVLSSRYFIREDDKVMELTHDVLAPIIKTDREKRKKDLALEAVNRRTKRRVIAILLFTLIAAAALLLPPIWERKNILADSKIASDERDSAKAQTEIARLEEKMWRDSIRILKETASKYQPSKVTTIIVGGDTIRINPPDTTGLTEFIDDKIGEIKRNLEKSYQQTISELTTKLNEKEIELNKYKDLLNAQPSRPALLDSIKRLNKEIETLSGGLKDLQPEINRLKKENEDLKKEIKGYLRIIDSLKNITGTISMTGRLYYQDEGNRQLKPSNIPVYLISKASNRRIVKNASVYEINCYEKELKSAKASFKTVTDANGNYTFRNVPAGDYLLKICTYYGGFYTVKITDSKKTLHLNLNASPPVRFLYAN